MKDINPELQKTFLKIKKRTDTIKIMAKEFDRKPKSIYNHWLSGAFPEVPLEFQERTKEIFDEQIKKQK